MKIICPLLSTSLLSRNLRGGLDDDWQIEDLLLPHMNINQSVKDWVDDNEVNATAYLGFFAADPFASWVDILERFQAKGIQHLCNFPSVGFHDMNFRKLLDEGGIGEFQEQKNLIYFQQHGFKIAWCAGKESKWLVEGHAPDLIVNFSDGFVPDMECEQIKFTKDMILYD